MGSLRVRRRKTRRGGGTLVDVVPTGGDVSLEGGMSIVC